MANAVPLLEGTNASGGFLVPDLDAGVQFAAGINRLSAVASMPGLRVRRISGKKEKYTEYAGRPTFSTVAEGADKAATGAAYTQLVLNIVKGSCIVLYTDELIDDAIEDPTVLINEDVRAAASDWVDTNALARNSSGSITSSFDVGLTSTTQTVELGTTGDAIAKAVSAAMAKVEGNGYNPNGVILAWDGKAAIRDARTALDATAPLYGGGFSNADPLNALYGLALRYSTNLQPFSTAAGAGVVKAIVGDFSQAVLAIRQDLTVDFSNQATVNVSGTDHRLWQQNKTAALFEARMGFQAHDINKAFCNIVDAS